MKDKKRLVLLIVSLLVLIGSVSYAYFEAVVHGTGNTNMEGSAHTATIEDLILTGTTQVVNSNMIPGESSTYSFTIQNPNDFQVCFGIYFDNITNTFVNPTDLEVSMNGEIGVFPTAGDTSTIIGGFRAPANSTTSYTLTVTYKDVVGKNQTGDIGAMFSGTIKARATECGPTDSERSLASLQALNPSITLTPSTATNPDFTKPAPNTQYNQTSGIFALEDDYGISYYFRGDINYNYVKFGKWQTDSYDTYLSNYNNYSGFNSQAECWGNGCVRYASAGDDMYWRIIRINGDGSIRMIYDGTSAYGKNDSEWTYDGNQLVYNMYGQIVVSNSRSIGKSAFKTSVNDNGYVGYKFGTAGSNNYNATHANTNDISIKKRIDSWYQNQMTGYTNYISDTLFCNDRSVASAETINSINNDTGVTYTTNAYGTNNTIYAPYGRLYEQGNGSGNKATLRCPQKNDAFTVSDTTYGNGALTYPVGLITIDEANIAGSTPSGIVHDNYLKTGSKYWTLSPDRFEANGANVAIIDENDSLSRLIVTTTELSVRPVINLKPNAITGGSGTTQDPFVVQ